MIRVLATALAAGMLLVAGEASATDDTAASAPAAPPPSAAPAPVSRLASSLVVCKRQETTGSRLGGAKICHTRQEWADIAAAARTSVDRMQSGANLAVDRH
jgi:hypothetical protein